jgi:hypothetical protein
MRNPKLILVAGIVLLSLFVSSYPASAISGSSWKAGRIIDDTIFTNTNSMSVSQIQQFLNSKMTTCDPNGTSTVFDSTYGDSVSRATYGARRGNPAPFTCLKDYYEVPKLNPGPGLPASNYGGQPIPAGAKSSAQIIWDVGREYNISPQVLLVTLQKETSLLYDEWPLKNQFYYAMGAYCPDGPFGAECSPNYASFSLQMRESASLFRYYLDNMQQPWWTNKKPYQVNNILWQVTTRNGQPTNCGGSNVYIDNKATAALYTYTPYQPNQAALNNMYGEGNFCSAYGNRNFWRDFNDWFGSSYAPNYAWSVTSQQIFADPARTKPVSWGLLTPGSTYHIKIITTNTGNRTWSRTGSNPVLLGTNNNANSQLCDSSWIACNRPALLKESSVAPGATGTFEFSVKIPSSTRTTTQYFNLVAEGSTWMDDIGMHLSMRGAPPTHDWTYIGQSLFTDEDRQTQINGSTLNPSTRYFARLVIRNSGNTTWTNSGSFPMRLGTSSQIDRSSPFCDPEWINCRRPSTMLEASVPPGSTATFEFPVKSPSYKLSAKEHFRPVVEGKAWLKDVGLHWSLNVTDPVYKWGYGGQSAFTDSDKSEAVSLNGIPGGSRVFLVLNAKNLGNTTWTNTGNNPIMLGTNSPIDSASKVCDSSWSSCNRAARIKQSSVSPGETGTFEFWAMTPYAVNGTTLAAYFRPVAEGKSWMNDVGQHWDFKLNTPNHLWSFQGQSSFTDSSRTQAISTQSMSPNTTYYLRLRAKNIGGNAWSKTNTRLGTSNPLNRSSVFRNQSWQSSNRPASLKESVVTPGQIGTFEFSITTPAQPDTYSEHFRPVIDGVSWMNDLGQFWTISTD